MTIGNEYLFISKADAEALVAGNEVEVLIGKRIKRKLSTKSLIEIKKEQLEAEYRDRLSALELETEL